MLLDRFRRKISYLRVSVTDKCNLRCKYCMPESGIKLKRHEDILSLEEIVKVVEYAASLGIEKIRLTGGEPLIRKNIEFLIEKISGISGVKDLAMTTNGLLLADRAAFLKSLGLQRVNISIDSLDQEKYKEITRGGELKSVLAGINAAKAAGLTPIKLNVVLVPGWNDDEKEVFLEFGRQNDLEVRFIHRMSLSDGSRYGVEGNTIVGQCDLCDRLRLTCDGDLKPCLFSDYKVNVRKVGLEKAFEMVLFNKPEEGIKNEKDMMYQIGG